MEIYKNNTTEAAFPENSNDSLANSTNALGVPTFSSSGLNFYIIAYLPEYLAAYWLDTTYLWILAIIGIVGNTLSSCTILKMSPLSSTSMYVVLLSIMDSFSLVVKLIYQQVTKHNIGIGNAGCRLLLYFGNSFVMTANWLVVAMTTERMVAVWFPLKISQISTKLTTCVVSGCLFAFFLCINVVYLFMFHENFDVIMGFSCIPLPEYWNYAVFAWIDACFYALVPCACLILLNSFTIFLLHRAMSIQRDMSQDRNQKKKLEKQVTVMLITVSTVFVLLTLPNAILYMNIGNWVPTTNKAYAVKALMTRIVLFLSDFNHAVNFFLYFFSARRFRQMFLDMICCRSLRR